MKRLALALGIVSFATMAAFSQPQPAAPTPATPPPAGDEPGPMDQHPPAGHPVVPKPAADWPKAKSEDVASIESIVAAYYASTAGKPKQARDWDRFKSLLHPQCRLIPARPTGDGGAGAFFLSPDDFIQQNRKYLEATGFVDREVAHRTETFGNIAQVWSTYESRHSESDSAPYSRGVASIQLLKDTNRWWIVNIFWDFERPENPIPEKYTQSPKN